jgi:asparagine synthase (glutamine-hydrolysing)
VSGLFGVFSFDRERRFDARALFRAARAAPHRDQETHEEGGLSWAVQDRLRSTSLAEDPERRVKAAVVGTFDDLSGLAEELSRAGYPVDAREADVAVAAFRVWGSAFVRRIDGRFALAVYDAREQRLLLARDGVGHFPLFYRVGPRDIAFSTQLDVLLRAKLAPRILDAEGAAAYFRLGFIPSPRTAVEGVRALPPGATLVARPDQVGVEMHRTHDFSTQDEATPLEAQLDRLEAQLEAAARRTEPPEIWFRPDLETVVLAAIQARATGASPETVAPLGDDARTARLAQMLGGRHRVIAAEPGLDDVVRLVSTLDQPLADPAWLVRDALGRTAARPVASALGAGPVFACNPRYPDALTADTMHRALPSWLDAWVQGPGLEAAIQAGPARVGRGLNPDFEARVRALEGPAVPSVSDPLASLQAADLRYRVGDGVLPGLAAWSARAGVDVGTPYLDSELIAGAARLPSRGRMEGRDVGAGLWRLARRLLPGRLSREDLGEAPPPVGEWLRSGLREAAEMAFFGREGGLSGLLDPAVLRRRWYAHQLGWADRGPWLYALMVFELWTQVVLSEPSP